MMVSSTGLLLILTVTAAPPPANTVVLDVWVSPDLAEHALGWRDALLAAWQEETGEPVMTAVGAVPETGADTAPEPDAEPDHTGEVEPVASECFDEVCLALLAERLQIRYLVVTQLSLLGGVQVVSVKLFDAELGAVAHRLYDTLDDQPASVTAFLQGAPGRILARVGEKAVQEIASAPETYDLRAILTDFGDEPVILHAIALQAEIDNDTDTAIALLRHAQATAPDDPTMKLELARVALQSKSPTLRTDAKPFLDANIPGHEATLLRAYVLTALGDSRSARSEVDQMLADQPGSGAANQLKTFLDAKSGSATGPRIAARVAAGAGFDSNAAVLPDDSSVPASKRQGVKASVNARIGGVIPTGSLTFDGRIGLHYAANLLNRADLAEYDEFSAQAVASMAYRGDGFGLSIRVNHNQIFLENFATYFMHSTGGAVRADWQLGGVSVGPFAGADFRDFRDLNPERSNQSPQPNDRDGLRVNGGVNARTNLGPVGLGLRGGIQTELADGKDQDEFGAIGRVTATWDPGPVALLVLVNYEHRHYPKTEFGARGLKARTDHRVTPGLTVRAPVGDLVRILVSYRFVLNASNVAFGYSRHIASAGVEAVW